MQNGISIYPGLDNTLPENLALIETAATLGIRRLFTSLHIPETDPTALKRDLGILLQAARAHRMEIISDVSPATHSLLGLREFSLSAFRMLGITTLRLDDGFTVEDIAHFSHNTQHIRLQLNASTMTPRLLQSLLDAKADLTHIDALHNFYPRTGTGLSEETLVRKTNLLHKAGIRVGAFLPKLLSLLAHREELCVCDIAEALGMGQSAISHQLRVLRNARLVKFRKVGKEAFYSLDDDHVVTLMQQGLDHVLHG